MENKPEHIIDGDNTGAIVAITEYGSYTIAVHPYSEAYWIHKDSLDEEE